MTDRTKKIIFAGIFVLISVGIGFGLYFLFFRPLFAPPPVEEALPEELAGKLPTAPPGVPKPPAAEVRPTILPTAPGIPTLPTAPVEVTPPKVTLLRDAVTQAVAPTPEGGARFYSPEDGRFYKLNPDGSISTLSDKQFLNVSNVNWGSRKDVAVLEFPDGSNVVYDFNSQRQVTLPKHWEDFDFSPDDQRLVTKSLGLDPTNRFLVVSDVTGNEAKAVAALGQNQNQILVNWSPNQQVIGFSKTGRPQAEGAEEVYLIGENRENFKSLIVPGRGFTPNWSPSGRNILYSVYHQRDSYRPSLWVSGGAGDSIGENRRGLNLQTWADKCAWRDEFSLICAVPQNLDIGAGLARDRFSTVSDDIYEVDLRTGVSSKISTNEQTKPVRNPTLSSDKKKLIFTDASTGQLFQYDLP